MKSLKNCKIENCLRSGIEEISLLAKYAKVVSLSLEKNLKFSSLMVQELFSLQSQFIQNTDAIISGSSEDIIIS